MNDTIFALSSGSLPSGLAVLRISGPKSRVAIETMCRGHKFGTPVFLSTIVNPGDGEVLDKGIVLTFVGPHSFTGEDIVEFHVHGGVAVVEAVLEALSAISGFRAAQAGEFTYRAFDNGKLDLTQAEGIADLIASESEAQRKLALTSVSGNARKIIDDWSDRLLRMRALIEAEIDFVDEDDIPGSVSDQVWDMAKKLITEMDMYLAASKSGEVVRDGFYVTLLGSPNAGKSTLLNCLAKRDVAIVSEQPGTTRDIVEIKMNLGGQIVYVSDTAGIRSTDNKIEIEGVRRAKDAASRGDFNIWLHAADDSDLIVNTDVDVDVVIMTKRELGYIGTHIFDLETSVFDNAGIGTLLSIIENASKNLAGGGSKMLFSRARQKGYLARARKNLETGLKSIDSPIEIRAEYLRLAAGSLGNIVGMRDNEDILGVIFSEFCVGK